MDSEETETIPPTSDPPAKAKKSIRDNWKLIMSSLFARTMPYLVTGFSEDSWIFSNVLPEQIQKNTIDSESAIHLVKFKNHELQQMLIEAFPMLGNTSVVVNVGTITKIINKCGIENCSLFVKDYNVHVKSTTEDPTLVNVLVGRVLSRYNLDYYIAWINRYVTRENLSQYDVILCPVNLDKLDMAKSEISLFEIHASVPGSSKRQWFRLPLRDGMNFPSVFEYVKKSQLIPTINAEIIWKGTNSVEVVVAFDDSNISVRSCYPRRIWYPMPEKK